MLAIVPVVISLIAVLVIVPGGDKASAGEVFTEPASDPGTDAFTPNVGAPPPASTSSTSPSSSSSTTPSSVTTAPPGRVSGVSGAEPGLYGGTRDNSSCDAQQMLTYLDQNPSKAKAWAAVEGISTDQIRDYVSQLTPVVLRSDTRVTNHGFANGKATSKQAILQAGTAVLVDKYGVPRVRCACGNPLTPPVAVKSAPKYTGPKWQGFNAANVVVVMNSTTVIESFTLINVNTGQPFARRAGGAVSGVADTDASLPRPGNQPQTAPSPPAAPGAPGSLRDVLGTYGNIQVSASGECAGLTQEDTPPFQVTVADPSRGVLVIATNTGNYTGTLAPDYSFTFLEPESGAALKGQFRREGGTIVMSAAIDFGCTISFTATKIGD